MMNQDMPQEPKALWNYFNELTQIPRPSQGEKQVIEYIKKYAEDRNLSYQTDAYGNLSVLVPAKNSQSTQRIIIQGHVDMVCDARPGVKIDFFKDPIKTIREGDQLKADATTLGADNGIGVAAALAIFDELDSYPPLNLLFTVDEERGLHGASQLDSKLLEGEVLLNLDGEDFGQFFIGCAGGGSVEVEKEFPTEKIKAHALELKISNLKGGHSGCDIHLNRQSANRLLFSLIGPELLKTIQIVSIEAGKAHNIISRDGSVTFLLNGIEQDKFVQAMSGRIESIEKTLHEDDLAVEIEMNVLKEDSYSCLSKEGTKELAFFALQHPHGALEIDWSFELPVTSLSCNLAKLIYQNGKFIGLISYRFNSEDQKNTIKEKLENFYQYTKMQTNFSEGYPSWKPNWESSILKTGIDLFKKNFGEKEMCLVTAMHAGLECGVLLSKKSELDALSFGPDIRNAHSPDEYVSISSVSKFWNYFSNLLDHLARS